LNHKAYVVALREKARVGPKGFQQLLMSFGSPDKVYRASKEELSSLPRMGAEKAERILRSQDFLEEIERHLLRLEEQGIRICTILDDDYPVLLRQIDDPPPLVYHRGQFAAQDKKSVAVIGTHRGYTTFGTGLASWVGRELTRRGVVVVSGLAEGIDTAAHQAVVDLEGITYAVLGTGLNKTYPSENQTLAERIAKKGALITEYDMDVPVKVGQLMARNRIVVGLSQAVIVVEMDEKSSGTMDAANMAIRQGKPLFVMRKENSSKVEELIGEGAVPLEGAEDLSLVVNYI
jgi:DNA processing protein